MRTVLRWRCELDCPTCTSAFQLSVISTSTRPWTFCVRGEYTFQVHPGATKPDIRRAIEQLFAVHVTGVWTSNQRGKAKRMGKTAGRKAHWKKAVVTLREGETIDTIDIFEG